MANFNIVSGGLSPKEWLSARKEKQKQEVQQISTQLSQNMRDTASVGMLPQYQKTPEFVRSNVDEQLDFANMLQQQKVRKEAQTYPELSKLPEENQTQQAIDIAKYLRQNPQQSYDLANSLALLKGYTWGAVTQENTPERQLMGKIAAGQQKAVNLPIIGKLPIMPTINEGLGMIASPIGKAVGALGGIFGGTATKAVSKVAPKVATAMTSKAVTTPLRVGLELGGYSGTSKTGELYREGGIQNVTQNLGEVGKSATEGFAGGTILGLAGIGVGTAISKATQPIKSVLEQKVATKAINQSLQNIDNSYSKLASDGIAGYSGGTPIRKIPQAPLPKYYLSKPMGEKTFTYKPQTQEVQGELLQRIPAKLKEPIATRPEIKALPAPVYKQPPVKPVKLGETPQGKFKVKGEEIIPTAKELPFSKYKKVFKLTDGEMKLLSEGELNILNSRNQEKISQILKIRNKMYKNNPNEYTKIMESNLALPKNATTSQSTKKLSELTPQRKTAESIRQYNKQMSEYQSQSADVAYQNKTGRVNVKDFSKEMPLQATPGEASGYAKNIYDARPNAPKKLTDYKIQGNNVNIIRRTPTTVSVSEGSLRSKLDRLKGGRVVEGEYIPPEGITPSQPTRVKSSRELPELHKMTQAETDAYYGLDKKYSSQNVKNMVEDVGAKVINKVGSNDIPTIVNHYKQKYNLPNVEVSFKPTKSGKLGTTEAIKFDSNGNPTMYRITINPSQSIEGKIGALRHEIEHVIDLKSGFKPNKQSNLSMKEQQDLISKTTREGYAQRQAGEHKNYKWFEIDYLRRASVKDALKSGQEVPQSVLDEFPDLKNIKPSKTIQQNVQAEIRPSETSGNINSPSGKIEGIKTQTTASEKTIGGTKGQGKVRERGFSTNEQTNINSDKALQENLASDKLNYMQLENKSTYARAKDIFDTGYENALNRFNAINKYMPHDVPLAHMIANEAAKRGDIETARNVIARISEKLTEAGQFGQAAKIMRRSDPATFYRYMKNNIERLNEDGFKRYGEKWKDLKLSPEVEREIFNLEIIDEASMSRLMERTNRDLVEQMPVDAWEKWDAWRRMSMLLNPKTWIKNTVGNAFMAGLRKSKDTLGAVLEKIFVKPGERTKSFLWSTDKDIVQAVKEDWVKVKDDLMQNNKYGLETMTGLNQEKEIFKKGFITKGIEKISGTEFGKGKLAQSKFGKKFIDDDFKSGMLEALNNISKKSLEMQDEFFMARAYRDALGQYMKANNLKSVTDAAREHASQRALEATFRQTNELASFIIKAKKLKYIGKPLDAAMPFTKTPLNIAKSAIDYSPAGLVKTLFDVKKGPQEVIETLSKGMVGSSLMGLGWYLGSMGWAKANMEKSKKAAALTELTGEQPYSIITPLGSYTFDWNQPSSLPLAMGVTLAENLSKNLDPEREINLTKAIANSLASAGDSYFNMTVLRNIKDLFGGGTGSVTEALASLPVDYLEQGIPTVIGQVSRSIDNKKRNTYDPNPLKMSLNNAMNRTLLSLMLPEKVDVLGDTKEQPSAWQQFISPGTGKIKNNDPLVQELDRLYEVTKKTDFLPKVVEKSFTFDKKPIWLKSEEIERFQRRMGELNREKMSDKINSSSYSFKSDEMKVQKLKEIAEKNYEIAKREILSDRGIETKYKKYVVPGKTLVPKN